jgi:hypothetical protein
MSNPYEGDSSDPSVPGIKGTNSKGEAVVGFGSVGVHGVNGKGAGASNAPPVGTGLWGESEFGFGVYGASSNNHGVVGFSSVSHGVHGVNGKGAGASNASPVGTGLMGESEFGWGVYGVSSNNNGIHGNSTNGDAIVGVAHAKGTAGILGISDSDDPNGGGNGVSGISKNGNGVFGSGGGFAGFFDGNVRVTRNLTVDQDVLLAGGDCAEQFDVAPSDEAEPGTVMVIGQDSALRQSREAYEKSVAGVVSGAGDYKPGIVLDQREPAQSRKPIALVGKVYCKVDADYSPVEVGDLLTTSPTAGHAMKAADPFKAFGAVIGKALRPLKSGKALIPILIALQ